MDSLLSETEDSSSTIHSKESQIGTFVHKRKFRRTNDYIVEELTDVHGHLHNSHKKKRPRNSFLPKIDDVKFTSYSLSNTSKPLSPHKIKILNLKLYRQKFETRHIFKTGPYRTEDNRIKRLRLKKAKGVWTPVESKESMKRELYIPLIPLEKTNLLTDSQLKQLTGDSSDNFEAQESEDSTALLLNSCRSCCVLLKPLTVEEIHFSLKRDMEGFTNLLVSNDLFTPAVTSSPNTVCKEQSTNNSLVNGYTDLEQINCDSKNTSNKSIIEINSTFEIKEDLTKTPNIGKKITWQDSSSRGNGDNENILNRTYEVDQTQDQKKTPKSVLKTNSRTPTNNNRRVTFNDTSIIIIHDSDTLYTSSTPTHFSEDHNDDNKRRSARFDSKPPAGGTPMPVLRNANSARKSNNLELTLSEPRKRTCMPDFAKIHKRMFEGMLDIKQHTEEKLKRSQLLLSGRKPTVGTKKKLSEDHISSIAKNLKKRNVAKVLLDKAGAVESIQKDKLDIKEKSKNSAFRKHQVLAFANKVCPNPESSRENNKVYIKGIRSNRRFELLMKLRKNQQKNNK